MRRLAMPVAMVVAVLIVAGSTYATTVAETISGSPGDWTYSYTLTNTESRPIWYWVVWFPTDPSADGMSADPNWTATYSTMGYYPEEFKSYWGSQGYPCEVYDAWPGSNDLQGPNGENGFYGAAASDIDSSNSAEYWDGSQWLALPAVPDPYLDEIWRGGWYGWTGSGANIQTSYGIPVGGTDQFSVHSSTAAPMTGAKSFSFSTTDHWLSLWDPLGPANTGDDEYFVNFEGSGDVAIPEPISMIFFGTGIVGVFGFVSRRRKMKRS